MVARMIFISDDVEPTLNIRVVGSDSSDTQQYNLTDGQLLNLARDAIEIFARHEQGRISSEAYND